MAMRKIAYVVFVAPVIISIIFGGYVLSNVLGQPDRQLNMWQFKFVTQPIQEGDKDIRIANLLNSYSTSAPLNFTVRVNNTAFDCGDLYLTIYSLDTSPKQVVTQNAYFSQCFAQNNSILPINDIFSPVIGKHGTYQIVAEMKDKSYQNSINVTGTFKVQ
jgi:hypothetical protein